MQLKLYLIQKAKFFISVDHCVRIPIIKKKLDQRLTGVEPARVVTEILS